MEHSRPDEQPVLDTKSKEVFMHNWLRRFERGEADPTDHHILSGERWQNTFRNMFQRAEAAPEKLDHTEQQYELRHEHKDVSAAAGLHVGAVIAGALGTEDVTNRSSPQSTLNSDGKPSKETPKRTTDPTFPGSIPYGSSQRLVSWLIVVILLVAIIALLSALMHQ